jgi:hypothetical protein
MQQGVDWPGGMDWPGKVQMTGIHSGQRGSIRQGFGMISLESSGGDCPKGMSFGKRALIRPILHVLKAAAAVIFLIPGGIRYCFKLISYLKRLVLSHRIQVGYYFSLKVLVVNNTDSYTVDRTIKG